MVRTLADHIGSLMPDGLSWSLYGAGAMYQSRAVLVSPDHRTHIGREADTIDNAIRLAARAARSGAKE